MAGKEDPSISHGSPVSVLNIIELLALINMKFEEIPPANYLIVQKITLGWELQISD